MIALDRGLAFDLLGMQAQAQNDYRAVFAGHRLGRSAAPAGAQPRHFGPQGGSAGDARSVAGAARCSGAAGAGLHPRARRRCRRRAAGDRTDAARRQQRFRSLPPPPADARPRAESRRGAPRHHAGRGRGAGRAPGRRAGPGARPAGEARTGPGRVGRDDPGPGQAYRIQAAGRKGRNPQVRRATASPRSKPR